MIVSHRHKFIYIKTIKTASTSIETALTGICGPDDIITVAADRFMKDRSGDRKAQNYRLDHPAVPRQKLWRRLIGRPVRYYHPEIGYYEHMPAWRVRSYLGEETWHNYFKFTFERNPWDRQVSFYAYKTRNAAARPSFEDFLNGRRSRVPNWSLYTIDGEIAVDFIGAYETLGADFNRVLDRLGLKGEVTLPKVNASERSAGYREYYSDHTRRVVRDWYRPEIDRFGYAF